MAEEVIPAGSSLCRFDEIRPSSTGKGFISKSIFTPIVTVMSENKNTISDELLLKISKEIAVKFIEVGRLTPATFETTFQKIYTTVKESVRKQ